MKKTISIIFLSVLCLLICACSPNPTEQANSSNEVENINENETINETEIVEEVNSDNETTEEPEVIEEVKPDYEKIVPEALQGVWCDTGIEGILSIYAFKDNNIETYAINQGIGAAKVLSGTYSVAENKVSYNFGGTTGFSNFTYDNDVFVLTNANGTEIKKVSAESIMEYLSQEESSGNGDGVVCLAELIINYYPDSAESGIAVEKKDAVNAAIKEKGENALLRLNTEYDKVEKLTWYEHKNQPEYTDVCNNMYPYIGRLDNGHTWLRVKLNYTDAQTDAGWIFFNKVIFSVDGENTTKSFARSELVRDNDTEVWEIADFEPNDSEVQLLKNIAASSETIIRFQGDEYHVDHVVTSKEKEAIVDVLTAYDYLKNLSEQVG